MKRLLMLGLWLFFLGLFGAGAVMAGEWPKTEAALAAWDGPKELLLRSDLEDPLASADVQGLLETLLEGGYVVTPAPLTAPAGKGLTLDFRLAGDKRVLALSRGADGAIIAFERKGADPVAPVRQTPAVRQAPAVHQAPPPRQAPAVWQSYEDSWGVGGTGPIKIKGTPRSVALLGVGDGNSLELALLSDQVLEKYRLRDFDLQRVDAYRPTIPQARALHLSAGDLSGDGRREVAAVWAEDVLGVYDGTDSKVHSWILGQRGEALAPLSQDLSGYVRILGQEGFFQRRGDYAPFSGPVFSLALDGEEYQAESQGVPWAGFDLYRATPFGNGEAMIWNEEQDLQLVSQVTGEGLPGAILLGDFAAYTGPEVAVRLEDPEYRSGFEKEDQVKEAYYPLPIRMAVGSDGAAYTVLRGRSKGLPLVGKASGRDAVVRVMRDGRRLRMQKPFADVEAFVVDFALVERSGHPLGVVMLLNEKEDGSGQAYLLFQESRQYN